MISPLQTPLTSSRCCEAERGLTSERLYLSPANIAWHQKGSGHLALPTIRAQDLSMEYCFNYVMPWICGLVQEENMVPCYSAALTCTFSGSLHWSLWEKTSTMRDEQQVRKARWPMQWDFTRPDVSPTCRHCCYVFIHTTKYHTLLTCIHTYYMNSPSLPPSKKITFLLWYWNWKLNQKRSGKESCGDILPVTCDDDREVQQDC